MQGKGREGKALLNVYNIQRCALPAGFKQSEIWSLCNGRGEGKREESEQCVLIGRCIVIEIFHNYVGGFVRVKGRLIGAFLDGFSERCFVQAYLLKREKKNRNTKMK